ncbi:bifunctional pyr operon transcriptional regulator/uracil phosphoribosyltransferase PyrR [Culicoidibacter larvae]|uniref:Bifunctional protein PyrR n=1 Tax=Culicoidibacter larvae TaxID=2579976 RepID=A0A5R8QB51_9FIRM|nr:bifunctional pyr operon transcriptional regulator/uracil phosphoribosyltransferase PyrR [Culicoidibacter larvae]TLG73811.1 bifunctional pyr operon transcriptional regulator/uracil phosphoribosyltransferase PyrR [Culicoidibacter larvae]
MKLVVDDATMNRMLTRITHEILEKNGTVNDTVLVGIKTRGIYLAERIASRIETLYQARVEVEELDISNYRDDQPHTGNASGITGDLTNKIVILVDDVLYTGRSIRAALDALVEHGRPKQIQLVTLVDRGHREFPIRPDYVGKNLPTANTEKVTVLMTEVDGEDGVTIN